MQDLLDEILKFQIETFPTSNAISKLHHLSREVPELVEELEQFDKGGGSIQRIKMEYADCFLLLMGSAAIAGFTADDIAAFVREKLEINRKRKWGKPDAQGVVLHIKD